MAKRQEARANLYCDWLSQQVGFHTIEAGRKHMDDKGADVSFH